jgi:hypothetical protein
MISAVFRRGVELAIVAEELKQVLDQRGRPVEQGPMSARWSPRSAASSNGT